MASLVAAFGTSHSVMLTARVEDWQFEFREADQRNKFYFDRQGRHLSYAEVLERAPPNAEAMVTPEKMAERFAAAQAAVASLRRRIAAANLDVLFIVGDDQDEIFDHNTMPAFALYYGDTIRNAKRDVAPDAPWFARARAERQEPDQDVFYPVDSALSRHLIRAMSDRGFDVVAMQGLPGDRYEGHAFSFPHRAYLSGLDVKTVPVVLNTFEPPNQPTPKRCLAFGAALREEICAYEQDLRVGFLASGGLSHFIVEEAMDRSIIEALKKKDFDTLAALRPEELMAGSSEIRNWLVVAEAARALDLTWVDYIPGYRTPALTGTGLCFAEWTSRS